METLVVACTLTSPQSETAAQWPVRATRQYASKGTLRDVGHGGGWRRNVSLSRGDAHTLSRPTIGGRLADARRAVPPSAGVERNTCPRAGQSWRLERSTEVGPPSEARQTDEARRHSGLDVSRQSRCLVSGHRCSQRVPSVVERAPVPARRQDLEVEHALRGLARSVPSRYPQRVLYNATASARQHEQYGFDPRKTTIIPNGVDCAAFKPDPDRARATRREFGIPAECPVVGLVARYHPFKDHEGFMAAAARLARSVPTVRFLLAGRGVDSRNRQLLQLVEQAGLAQHVTMLGERDNIAAVFNACDVVCSSSRVEGFSNSIAEAMACGVPCVVTDVGDSAAIVADTGIAVATREPAQLAKALRELVELDPHDRVQMGRRARARIRREFSLDSVVAQYRELYLSAERSQSLGVPRTGDS